MFDIAVVRKDTKKNMYDDLTDFMDGLFYDERDPIANLANLASLLYNILPNVNWAGFYLYKGDQLVLGPFHGKPACIRINLDRGVCGAAGRLKTTQLVPDVHAFPGHIACDGDTNSEIVVPIIQGGKLIGVLDIDSPVKGNFDEQDQRYLEELVAKLIMACDFDKL